MADDVAQVLPWAIGLTGVEDHGSPRAIPKECRQLATRDVAWKNVTAKTMPRESLTARESNAVFEQKWLEPKWLATRELAQVTEVANGGAREDFGPNFSRGGGRGANQRDVEGHEHHCVVTNGKWTSLDVLS